MRRNRVRVRLGVLVLLVLLGALGAAPGASAEYPGRVDNGPRDGDVRVEPRDEVREQPPSEPEVLAEGLTVERGLPVTGEDVIGLITVGALAVAIGSAVLLGRRRARPNA